MRKRTLPFALNGQQIIRVGVKVKISQNLGIPYKNARKNLGIPYINTRKNLGIPYKRLSDARYTKKGKVCNVRDYITSISGK